MCCAGRSTSTTTRLSLSLHCLPHASPLPVTACSCAAPADRPLQQPTVEDPEARHGTGVRRRVDGASTPAIDTCHPQPFQRLSSAAAGLFLAFPLPFQWTVVNFVAAFPCVSTTLTKCTVLSTDVRRTRCGDRCLAAVASGGRGRGPTNAERLGGQRHQSEVIRAIMLEDSLYLRGREEPAGVLSIELSTSQAGGARGGRLQWKCARRRVKTAF